MEKRNIRFNPVMLFKIITLKKLVFAAVCFAMLTIEAQAGPLVSKLYAVTGDGGSPAETLFELDMTDASSSLILTLGNGDDGEAIAFNPDDGLLYHMSGNSNKVMETINTATLAISPITISGDVGNEVAGLTHEEVSGDLLAAHRTASVGLYSITTLGVGTSIGATEAPLTGLAYVGSTLYAVSKSDDLLRTINPLTGATLSSVTITLATYTVSGATGLATDPVDDTLWALLKVTDSPINPSLRAVATIDPSTGVATLVGISDVTGLAGIAFVSGNSYTVTSSVGAPSGSISPLGTQTVISNHTASFTLTPDTGYHAESVGGTCGGTLVGNIFTTSAVTADCTVVANFEIDSTTKLYGVTGDGGLPAETLFRLSMTDASSTLVLTLGNGADGEEIAFNRDDGLLYHASGTNTGGPSNQVLETIDLATLTITPVPLSGFGYKEISGLTYAGSGVLLASDHVASTGLVGITTTGVATNIGATETALTGLAYIGPTLYAVGRNDDLLRTVDPSTGATLGSVTITLSGYTITGATGLTTNPDDNSLWALLKYGSSPTDRVLATIDYITGVATFIGITDVAGLAGLAFEFIPCVTCEVTPSVGGGPGTISPSTVQNVTSGGTTVFTLTPDANYHVDFVTGTCGGSLVGNTFTTAVITNHCTVEAYFTIDTFDLNYTAGAGGSVSGDLSQTVDYGSDGTSVTAMADEHYHFVDWSDAVATAIRQDTNVMADINVSANFEIDTHNVTSSVGAGLGSIDPLGGQQIEYGSSTQFTLTPSPNYHILSVGGSCGGSLVGNTYTTATIIGDCTVVANFTIDTFDLNYAAGNGGSITGNTSQTVDYDTNGTPVTAVADEHYHFVDWSDAVATATRQDMNVMTDISVTANFTIDTHTVTSSVGTGPGTISPLGDQTVDYGSNIQFTLTPAANHHVESVTGTCGGSLLGDVYTTDTIIGDCTVVASFTIDTFDLNYTAGANGSITGDTTQTVDYGADGTSVTADPDTNFHFVDWSDGVTTASRQDTNVMTDINVTAGFEIDSYTVTSSVGLGSGTISPSGGQPVDHGETTEFVVTPDPNYHILSVEGSCGGALVNNTYTTSAITADCTVVANFEIDSYTVTSSVGSGLGSISPLGAQTFEHGETTQFTLVPDPAYRIQSVSGTCGGSLEGDTYTTLAITIDCSVVANFVLAADLIFKDGFE